MKNLTKDIESGTFRHVYLLTGEEEYLMNRYRDSLIHALMPEENSMNLSIFSGNRLSETEIIDQAETLPFFADRRVIRLDHTGFFKNASERLPDYIASVPDYLYLVFTETEVDKRNRLYKAVSKNGYIAEFPLQNEQTLSAWILRILSKEQLRIRQSVMQQLLARTGSDMTHIELEVDKLVHYCISKRPDGDIAPLEVTAEDVLAVTSEHPEDRIFDMITALSEHRRRDAMNLYADLLAGKTKPMAVLFLIGQQYQRLLYIQSLDAEGHGAQEIASKAGMPPFAVRKNLRLARSYKPQRLQALITQCAEMDERIKTGQIDEKTAVEMVLMGN